jgi:hypothetical protein
VGVADVVVPDAEHVVVGDGEALGRRLAHLLLQDGGTALLDRTPHEVTDPELAAELMLAFGPDGAQAKGREGTPPMQIVQWLMSSYPFHPNLRSLVTAVLEGLQALEHAGLLAQRTAGTGTGAQRFYLTTLGQTALAQGSARQYLAQPSGS